MMADKIEITCKAYTKALLHAAKYPHKAVNGVFLASTKKSKNLEFVDCVPLFHISLTLAPMLEVALTQIDDHCQREGLVIAGYYQGNEHYKDSNPNLIATKIASKLHGYLNNACLFMIDNKKMTVDCTENIFKLYLHQEGKWKQSETNKVSLLSSKIGSSCLAVASSLLISKSHRLLVDFDCHLDDITNDWLNPKLNSAIDKCC